MTPFYKFHGTGNDFIMIDGFTTTPFLSSVKIKEACNRHTGIGADGIIVVAPSEVYDFEMIYFNADGSKAKMCGNGARCAAAFCQMIGIASGTMSFMAGDGLHYAEVKKTHEALWEVEITMGDTEFPFKSEDLYCVNTGTQHVVKIVDSVGNTDVMKEGPAIRNDARFKPDGVNVNFISFSPGIVTVRTYEKGVEAETLSCGTGVTASAIVAGMLTYDNIWKVETKGGTLEVSFVINDEIFTDVKLKGPAKLVFTGETMLI
ncbi:MAG TPA: diaminopimelate epimerase [Lentimicrobium sp.]|nr:diaminopimelate epimerase [Lentimicrobium sp.]